MLPKVPKLSPILKYPGGKDKELVHILPRLPQAAQNYFEPFVGGGAVFFAIDAQAYFINDKSSELMSLYRAIRNEDNEFLDKLNQIEHNWRIIEQIVGNHSEQIFEIYSRYKYRLITKQNLHDEISSFVLCNANEFNGLLSPNFNIGIQNFINELIKSFKNKIVRMVKLEGENGDLSSEDFILNIECAFKSAFYTHFRYLYNNATELGIGEAFYTAIYFFIREFCYSSMFRYNAHGHFNVPYGGISYNKKSLSKKIEYFSDQRLLQHLEQTIMSCSDFEDFLQNNRPNINDFMFLDPPYDTEFNTYAGNTFDQNDQVRLANYLKNQCDCYFMLIIKNTEFILSLYHQDELVRNGRRIKIQSFDKKYSVSFQNRNHKEAKHLIITNY